MVFLLYYNNELLLHLLCVRNVLVESACFRRVVIENKFTKPVGVMAQAKYKINLKQKYQFSFIADTIPNVRSLFYINGKKYLCEKITATFTENGMSQLLKGSFYLII